jgi:hypothetical protein
MDPSTPRGPSVIGRLGAHGAGGVGEGVRTLAADAIPALEHVDETVLKNVLRQGGVSCHDPGNAEELVVVHTSPGLEVRLVHCHVPPS